MRRLFTVALTAVAVAFGVATNANAGGTIDLLWLDNSGDTLTVDPGDAVGSGCGGFNNPNANQVGTRCLQVVFTVDEGFIIQSHSVTWNTPGLEALYATLFIGTTIGKTDVSTLGAPGIDNGAGEISSFTATTPPPNAPPAIPAGTYALGTIVWDTANAATGMHAITALFLPGDVFGDAAALNGNTRILFNGATLNVVPEPGTASLLGLGLVGLVLAGRRSRQ